MRIPLYKLIRCITAYVLTFLLTYAFGQNLVPNPSFELNTQLDENPTSITSDFKHVRDWKLLGWQSFYCHCKTHDPQNWYITACRNHLYQPRTGCGMVKMVYEESSRTDTDLHSDVEYKGAASYLECKLNEPLELGAVYEMSFWVYFPIDSLVEQSILTHIGFLPTLQYVSMRPQSLLHVNGFFADSIPMGEWYQVKKYIRALCPLQYLVIGAFRDNAFPLIHRFIWNYPFYFIDDVKVERIDADTLANNITPTPYCKFYEEETVRLEVPTEKGITLYFETDSSQLSLSQASRLDSFISVVDPRWSPVYSLVGHTDNSGHENEQLAVERAQRIKERLKRKYQIPDFRLISFGAGSQMPAATNDAIAGRALNRRVEVSVTSLHRLSGLYRYFTELVQQRDYAKAGEYVKKWIAAAKPYDVIYLLFDYRFDKLRETREWSSIHGEIQQKYAAAYPSPHAFYLDSLRCEDQRYRTLEMPILNLSGYFKEYESFDFTRYACDDLKMDSTDAVNLRAITSFLDQHGFPTITAIGRRNVQGIAYILIHAEDTVLFAKYLPILEQRCMEGEAEWNTYAMMYDRDLLLKGYLQQYGTQSVLNDRKTEMRLAPLDDLQQVNRRREQIGLPPLTSDQVREVQKVIHTPSSK